MATSSALIIFKYLLCTLFLICNIQCFQNRNPRVPCRSLPDIDLSHWREEVTQCRVNGLDISLGSSRKISPCTSCTCTKEGVSIPQIR